MKQQKKSRQVTCQARLELDEETEKILSSYAAKMCTIERQLFADLSKGKKSSDLKSLYLKNQGLTARQFNSIRIGLEGKIASKKECQKRYLALLESKIKGLKKRAKSLEKKKKWDQLHQVKRRIFNTEKKWEKEDRKKQAGKISLCFGGQKLFSSQFYKEENNFSDHAEWKKLWQEKRNTNFFLVGSKDETSGNQTCQIKQQEDENFSLAIRLPNRGFTQKTLNISDISISYRKKELLDCIKNNEARKLFEKQKKNSYKEMGQAINYRFLKDKKGWRVFITFEIFEPEWINLSNTGSIGIDINVNHIALVETDRFGNPIDKMTFPLCCYGKTKSQSLALIGDVSAQIVAIAKSRQKPIVLENLDFERKKANLNKTESKKKARMLSSFAYTKIIETIQSRAWSEKIEVFQVNAAYTSVIGKVNYAKKYGFSPHHAAALVIARRHMRFSEKPSSDQVKLPDGKGGHVTFFLPERTRGKHVWSYWARVIRGINAVYVKYSQRAKNSSSDPPMPIFVSTSSENWGRDSLTLVVGNAALANAASHLS